MFYYICCVLLYFCFVTSATSDVFYQWSCSVLSVTMCYRCFTIDVFCYIFELYFLSWLVKTDFNFFKTLAIFRNIIWLCNSSLIWEAIGFIKGFTKGLYNGRDANNLWTRSMHWSRIVSQIHKTLSSFHWHIRTRSHGSPSSSPRQSHMSYVIVHRHWTRTLNHRILPRGCEE